MSEVNELVINLREWAEDFRKRQHPASLTLNRAALLIQEMADNAARQGAWVTHVESELEALRAVSEPVRLLDIKIALEWPGHDGINTETTTTENLLKLIGDAVEGDRETIRQQRKLIEQFDMKRHTAPIMNVSVNGADIAKTLRENPEIVVNAIKRRTPVSSDFNRRQRRKDVRAFLLTILIIVAILWLTFR